jgi:hypothetical protein
MNKHANETAVTMKVMPRHIVASSAARTEW